MKFLSFCYIGVLVWCLSFRAGIYGTKTGKATRKIKFVIFACSFASIAGGHTAFVRLNLCRTNGIVFAEDEILYFWLFVRESWSGTLPHFFRLYEKSTKKVHEGLASPLDSRGRRKTSAPLRSAGFTAILEIPHYAETQESTVYLYLLATAG